MTRRVKVLLAVNILLLAVFLGFSGWTATRIEWATVGRSLREADLGLVVAMAGAWLAVLFIRPLRLMALLEVMSPESPRRYGAVWSATMVAMGLNTIVPLRAGDIAMTFVLYQRLGVSVPRALSAMMVDRFFDLATVMALFAAALSVAPVTAAWTVGLVPSMLIALVGLSFGLWLIVHYRALWLGLVRRMLSAVAPERRARWMGRAEELFGSIAAIDKTAVLAKIITLSILIWLTTTLSYWCGIAATWPSAAFMAAAFTASAAALVFVVPVTPAGIGVFHGTCVLALSAFDVPFEPALAFAIVAHALQVVSVLLLAVFASFFQGLSLRMLLAPVEVPAQTKTDGR